MTINYAIGRNSTEGRAHTMCIEGTEGTEGRKVGSPGTRHPERTLSELGWGGLGLALVQPRSRFVFCSQAVRTPNRA